MLLFEDLLFSDLIKLQSSDDLPHGTVESVSTKITADLEHKNSLF